MDKEDIPLDPPLRRVTKISSKVIHTMPDEV